jgi:hypothetical protein
MKILTEGEVVEWLDNASLTSIRSHSLQPQFQFQSAYLVPDETGTKTALARFIARSLPSKKSGFVWVTEFDIFPSSANLNLFYSFRKSIGEKRSLNKAPFHVFTAKDSIPMECILDCALYFYWDATIMNGDRTIAFGLSHDEYIEVAAKTKLQMNQLRKEIADFGLKEIESRGVG